MLDNMYEFFPLVNQTHSYKEGLKWKTQFWPGNGLSMAYGHWSQFHRSKLSFGVDPATYGQRLKAMTAT